MNIQSKMDEPNNYDNTTIYQKVMEIVLIIISWLAIIITTIFLAINIYYQVRLLYP